jgi:hypothetical protein
MAGAIQSAVNAALGTVAAGVAIGKGVIEKEQKAEEEVVSDASKAETAKLKAQREAAKTEIAQTRLESEKSRLAQEKQKEQAGALKAAQAQQRAKEQYLNIIQEKQLGTRLGTRTSMAEYLMAASGNTLDKATASNLARTMSSREIRKVKESGGARSGNK